MPKISELSVSWWIQNSKARWGSTWGAPATLHGMLLPEAQSSGVPWGTRGAGRVCHLQNPSLVWLYPFTWVSQEYDTLWGKIKLSVDISSRHTIVLRVAFYTHCSSVRLSLSWKWTAELRRPHSSTSGCGGPPATGLAPGHGPKTFTCLVSWAWGGGGGTEAGTGPPSGEESEACGFWDICHNWGWKCQSE